MIRPVTQIYHNCPLTKLARMNCPPPRSLVYGVPHNFHTNFSKLLTIIASNEFHESLDSLWKSSMNRWIEGHIKYEEEKTTREGQIKECRLIKIIDSTIS